MNERFPLGVTLAVQVTAKDELISGRSDLFYLEGLDLFIAYRPVELGPNEGWDALVDRLAWARGQGYTSAKARCCGGECDRPLISSECAELGEAATAVALDAASP